ncbi:MAG: hypothetical protein K1X83_00950 [Oligoflexia bacterium]|nr:hypothetical protein [Oligoflexia bacterium]
MAKKEKGSIELIVLGLLAALIVVLAIPMLTEIGQRTSAGLIDIRNHLPTPTGSN